MDFIVGEDRRRKSAKAIGSSSCNHFLTGVFLCILGSSSLSSALKRGTQQQVAVAIPADTELARNRAQRMKRAFCSDHLSTLMETTKEMVSNTIRLKLMRTEVDEDRFLP
jgi:hypothetical protein